MQQEELAQLFSANLTLSPPPQPATVQEAVQQPPQQQQEQEQPAATESQPIIYASTHYTHSHHVVPIRHIPQSRSAPASTHIDASDLEAILLRNSIDPSMLFPSQVQLFQNADDDQRLRLLELWRISPPQGRQGVPDGLEYNMSRQLYDWPPTSLAQEEAMAKLRYEKMMEEQAQKEEIARHQQQLEQSMDVPNQGSAEPYILSGYDMLAKREYEESASQGNLENHLRESTRYNQSTDPVYNSAGNNGWEKTVGVQDMENQYGAFEAARYYDPHVGYGEVEMVM